MELSLELRGQVPLYLAGRALDATLMTDLAVRAGSAGAQEWMDALFAAPLGSLTPREMASTLAQRRSRMLSQLPQLAAVVERTQAA